MHEKAKALLNQFDSIQLVWIPRLSNELADSAVRKVVQDNQPKKAPKTPQQPKKPSSSNPPKNKNKKKETITIKAAIEKLHNLSLPTMPPLPHLAQQINSTIEMGKKARVSDYESLKSGWDEFSSKRLPTLMERDRDWDWVA